MLYFASCSFTYQNIEIFIVYLCLQEHVPIKSSSSHISAGKLTWNSIFALQFFKYFSATLFVLFLFLDNSIERVVTTLWSPNQRWVRPWQRPTPGEHLSMVSRMIMEVTFRTSPLTWPHPLMCSYIPVKEQAMEWTSLELLYFLPLWVRVFFILSYWYLQLQSF